MKINRFVSLLFTCVLSLSLLTSCLDDDDNVGTNIIGLNDYVVVEYSQTGQLMLRTIGSYVKDEEFTKGVWLYAENLQSKMWDARTPLLVYASMDRNNQPYYPSYYVVTAKEAEVEKLLTVPVTQKQEEIDQTNLFALENLQFYPYDEEGEFVGLANDITFVGPVFKANESKKVSYKMVYEEVSGEENVFDVYFLVQEDASGRTPGEALAVDLNNLIVTEGVAKGRKNLKMTLKYYKKNTIGDLEVATTFSKKTIWVNDETN